MNYNVLVYAFIGDAYYELLVRDYLIEKKICKLKELKEESLQYVTATRQAYFLTLIEDILSDEEKDIVKRGRNAKINSRSKSCDVLTYKHATAFECLIGYLYKNNKIDRINEIFEKIVSGD